MRNMREVMAGRYFAFIVILFIILAAFGWWVENAMEKHHGPDATPSSWVSQTWV